MLQAEFNPGPTVSSSWSCVGGGSVAIAVAVAEAPEAKIGISSHGSFCTSSEVRSSLSVFSQPFAVLVGVSDFSNEEVVGVILAKGSGSSFGTCLFRTAGIVVVGLVSALAGGTAVARVGDAGAVFSGFAAGLHSS